MTVEAVAKPRRPHYKDLTGKTFGKLIVMGRGVDYIGSHGRTEPQWLCLCDCGQTTEVRGQPLRDGRTQSCGCAGVRSSKHSRTRAADLCGQVFGELTALERVEDKISPSGWRNVMYRCSCSCGGEKVVMAKNLKTGQTRSCGCLAKKPRLTANGYVRVHAPGHPNAYPGSRQILEHVLVMSEHLGRPLVKGENVHHKNGNRADNRIENLELWSTSQPPGQRIDDKVEYAVEILRLYRPDLLAGG